MDGLDYEYVKIGDWKYQIPSDICVNRDIFNEIFSIETWNKVLTPDQRERIINFLPPEVLQTQGASQQTMEDLLARTLNRFDTNPLDTFFEQLEQGRFDPDVVQTRAALQKAWHKESIRKRKKYHSELLQEVIVSRERHLKQRLEFSLADTASPSLPFSDIYSFDEPSLPSPSITNTTNFSSPSYTAYAKSQVKSLNSLESQVEKRYREEISAINRQAGYLSSSDDESPPKKIAKMSRKSTRTKTATSSVKVKPLVGTLTTATKMSKPVSNDSVVELSVQAPLNCMQTSSNATFIKQQQSPLLSIPQMTSKHPISATTTTIAASLNTNRGPLLTLLPNQNVETTALITTQHSTLASSLSSNILTTLSSSSSSLPSLSTSGGSINNNNSISIVQNHLNTTSNNSRAIVSTVATSSNSPLASSKIQSTSTMIPVVISTSTPTTMVTSTPISGGIVIGGIKVESSGLLPSLSSSSSSSSLLTSSNLYTTTTAGSNNVPPSIQFQNNPSKSSPILASQLQAPTQLSMSNINNSIHRVTANNSFKFPSIQNQNIKVRNCSEDEMESSSDDEFESIEPTIHLFATNPTTTTTTTINPTNSTSKLSQNKMNLLNSKSSSSTTTTTSSGSISNTQGSLNKSSNLSKMSSHKISLQQQQQQTQLVTTSIKTSTVTTLANSFASNLSSSSSSSTGSITQFSSSSKFLPVQLNKILNTQQQSQPLTMQQQLQLQQQQQPKVNVVKVVPHSSLSGSGSNTITPYKNTYSPKVSISNIKVEPGNFPSNVQPNILVQTINNNNNSNNTSIISNNSSSNINNTIRVTHPKLISATATTSTTNSSTQKLLPISLQSLQQSLSTKSSSGTMIRPTMITLPTSTTTANSSISCSSTNNPNSNQPTLSSLPNNSSTQTLIALNGPLSVPVSSILNLNTNNNNNNINSNNLTSGNLNNTSNTMSCITSTLGSSNSNNTSNTAGVKLEYTTTNTAGVKLESVGELQMFNLLGQSNINVMDALGGDLNLNLSLSMNSLDDEGIEDFVDQKYSKLPDMDEKIDDFQCALDGNPFDSIPNLSDELGDVLDLDLVEGLCDFDGFLSEEKQHASFFSLIRDVLCSTRDHRMTLQVLEKTIRKWTLTPTASLNLWFHRVNDWNEALITALNFLAGNYQEAHPEDFVPYIEYKYKTKYYQWIGAGRDSDNNLTTLCNMWLENVDRLPPLKKLEAENEDQEEEDDENESDEGVGEEAKAKKSKRPQTPPPPRCLTDWSVRPSTKDEKETFQKQERIRFENPHKAFTYKMHGYESVVGPVKGVYSSQSGMTNKARGHSLLVDDRPPYVTILALVRDAVARLPNGEGTRSEICEMLRDSAFLAAEASNVTLNSVVSGALDRLHYERDPCVRYDSHKKSWVYLHRDRTQEQFERLHHNRSYTKSTKSRSNSSRKNRKPGSKSQSQSSSPGSSGNTKDTVIVITTTAPTSSLISTNTTTTTTSTTTSTSVTTPPLTIATPGSTIGIMSMASTPKSSLSSLVTSISNSSNTTTTSLSSSPIMTPTTTLIPQQQTTPGTANTKITTKLPPVGTLIAKTATHNSSTNAPVLQFTTNNLRQVSSSSGGNYTVSTANLSTPNENSKSKVLNPATTTKHTIVSTTNAEGIVKQIFNVDSGSQLISGSASSSHTIRKLPLNEVLAAASLGGQTIRFATIPTSSASSVGLSHSGNSVNVLATGNIEQSTGSNIVFRTAPSNLHSLGGNVTNTSSHQTISSISNTVNRPGQTVAVQVQNISTTGNNSITTNSTTKTQGTPITISQPGNVTNTAAINPGQLILNPQTLLRLANTLRLPEGVRFAQVRFPTQQTTSPHPLNVGSTNPVRIPQQRIILTRASVSGQNQTPGVFLGTTPQGQTILLSTGLGHLTSGTSQIPISITTSQQGSSLDTSNIVSQQQSQSSQPQQQHVNPNRTSGSTISIMANSHLPSGNVMTSRTPTVTTGTHSTVMNNSIVISSSGTTTMMPILTQTQSSGNVLQTVASVASQIQSQQQQAQQTSLHQTQQQTANTTTQLPNTSPIFVYPSQFALGGRGIQTIKVIPVQTATGKQTVLARFVSPKTSQAQPAASTNNTQ